MRAEPLGASLPGMNTTLVTRLALTAAALFAAAGTIGLAHEQPSTFASGWDYMLEAAFAGALTIAAAALWRLRWRVAAAGHAAIAASAWATVAVGHDALGPVFLLGLLATTAGTVALAVRDIRGQLVPRRAGVLLLGSWVFSIALAGVLGDGTILLAAAWFGLARLTQEPAVVLRPANAAV